METGKPIALGRKQSELWHILNDATTRRVVADGPARCGKTVVIASWIGKMMAEVPGIRIAALRQKRLHVKTTLFDNTFRSILGWRKGFTFKEGDLTIEHANGSICRCDGLDDAARVDRIMGDEYGAIFFNEAAAMKWASVKVALSRLSQEISGLKTRKAIFDTNPKGPMHWLYRAGVMHVDPETGLPLSDADTWKRIQFILDDNAAHLPADTIASLAALTGVERKRLYEGLWASAEGLCYPEFSIERHVKHLEWMRLAESYIVGVDCGGNDPNVLLLFAVILTPQGKALHLCDAYARPGKDMSISIADVAQRWKMLNAYYTVDPSASPAVTELNARGFRAENAMNKIRDGITIMRDLIRTDRFSIEPAFQEPFLDEIGQYEFDPKTELPVEGTPDHWLDSSRYACCALQATVQTIINPTFYGPDGQPIVTAPKPKSELTKTEQEAQVEKDKASFAAALAAETGGDGWVSMGR